MRKSILISLISIASFLFVGFFSFIIQANATLVGNSTNATLSVSPQSGQYNVNDTFKVSIFVNTAGNSVNTVTAHLSYDKSHFEVVSIDTTNSIFTMEAEKIIDSTFGKIKIVRGIPTPGVNTANGLVAAINFKAISNVTPAADNLTFDFVINDVNKSGVFLDDGNGTFILTGVNGGKFTVGQGGPITYPTGSLLKANNSNSIYLIENGLKRLISSAEIFTANGYSWSNVLVVDSSVLANYPDGSNVTMPITPVLEGDLIRAKGTFDIYIVKYIGNKKFKRLILSPSVFNSYGHLKWSNVKDVEQTTLNSFTTSELVRAVSDPKVYKLYPSGDTGEKRWVKTADVFSRLGFDWDSVYQINQVDRDSYTTGTDLE